MEEDDKQDCPYIVNAIITDDMRKKRVAACDSGHGVLVQFVSEDEDGAKIKFKYTRAQRNAESKINRNRKIRDNVKSSLAKIICDE